MSKPISISIEQASNLINLAKNQNKEGLRELVIEVLGKQLYRKNNQLSFRRGAIAILEEEIIESKNQERDYFDYWKILKKTKVRFSSSLTTRNYKKFNTLEKIHPKKPCDFFAGEKKDKNHSKRHYVESLEKILLGKDWILENKDAEKTITIIFEETKGC